ncbi:MAG TPA: hypothetical protein V6C81_30520 [Planktothrix sp.]|jgi:hypothetical protein
MFQAKRAVQATKVVAGAGFCAMILSSCISASETGTTQVTPQGTVPLESVKAGMPEQIFKNAHATFIVDTHPAASSGGKTQYISRFKSATGGQYMAQCKDDRCYELQVVYTPSITKEQALATLKQLAPADAGDPIEDDRVISDKKLPRSDEVFYFGNRYLGIVLFDNKQGKQANTVDLYALPPQTALKWEYGTFASRFNLPPSAKSDSVAAAPAGNSAEH